MKSIVKITHLASVIFLSVGTFYSGFVLFNLATEIEQASGKIDMNVINEVSPVLNKVYVVLGLTLIFGLASCFRLLYHIKSQTSQTHSHSPGQNNTTQINQEITDENTSDISKTVRDIKAKVRDIKDPKIKYGKLLGALCMKLEASQGLLYEVKKEKRKTIIELMTSFAFNHGESEKIQYEIGEGLVGQVAKEGKKVIIDEIPEGYITVISGLGAASPNHLAIIPIMNGKEVVHIVEIASFKEMAKTEEELIEKVLQVEENKKMKKPASSKNVKLKNVIETNN